MTVQTKTQSIDQKIAHLKKRKAQLAQQHLQALARLVERCGLANFTPETLAGALLEIKQLAPQKQEGWLQAGEMFLLSKRVAKARAPANQIAENLATHSPRPTPESPLHECQENPQP